jgi:hypothetical protein
MNDTVAIAILAKAPVPGLVKTRLIPVLGAGRAAALAARLIERTVAIASQSAVGPVTLWAAPDESDLLFQAARDRHALTALTAAKGPALVIGTDCPALTSHHLRNAANVLCRGADAVVLPAEDGGYVLIGLRSPRRELFEHMCWGTARVLGETRRRLKRLGLTWQEPAMLWDLDLPADIERLRAMGLQHLIP